MLFKPLLISHDKPNDGEKKQSQYLNTEMNEWNELSRQTGKRAHTKRNKSHLWQQSEMEKLHTVLESFNYELQIYTHTHTRHVHTSSREYYIIWLDCIRLCQYVMNWFPLHSVPFRSNLETYIFVMFFFRRAHSFLLLERIIKNHERGEIERNRWIEWQPLSMRSHCWCAAILISISISVSHAKFLRFRLPMIETE